MKTFSLLSKKGTKELRCIELPLLRLSITITITISIIVIKNYFSTSNFTRNWLSTEFNWILLNWMLFSLILNVVNVVDVNADEIQFKLIIDHFQVHLCSGWIEWTSAVIICLLWVCLGDNQNIRKYFIVNYNLLIWLTINLNSN